MSSDTSSPATTTPVAEPATVTAPPSLDFVCGLSDLELRTYARALNAEIQTRSLDPSKIKLRRERKAQAKLEAEAKVKLETEAIKLKLIQVEEKARQAEELARQAQQSRQAQSTAKANNTSKSSTPSTCWSKLSMKDKISYAARLPSNYDNATLEKYVRDSFKMNVDAWEKQRADALKSFESPPQPDPKARDWVIKDAISKGASTVDAEMSFAHQWKTSICDKVDQRRRKDFEEADKTWTTSFAATKAQIDKCAKRRWVQFADTAKLIEMYESSQIFDDDQRESVSLNAFVAASFGGRLDADEMAATIEMLKLQAAATPGKPVQ